MPFRNLPYVVPTASLGLLTVIVVALAVRPRWARGDRAGATVLASRALLVASLTLVYASTFVMSNRLVGIRVANTTPLDTMRQEVANATTLSDLSNCVGNVLLFVPAPDLLLARSVELSLGSSVL